MSLRVRLVLVFAFVAGATAIAIVLATPLVIRYEFEQIEGPVATDAPTPTANPTASPRPTPTPSPSRPPSVRPSAGPSRTPGQASPGPSGTAPGPSHTPGGSPVRSGQPQAAPAPSAGPGGPHAAEGLVLAALAPAGAVPDVLPAAASSPPQAPLASPEPSLPASVRVRWVEFERRTSQTLALVAILAVAAASILGLLLAEWVIRPLRRLGAAASAVAAGDLARRSGLGSRRDEIGELGRDFDTMAEALAAGAEGRRRFLQDVAHELRTPLTVIEATSSALLEGVYRPEPRHLETIREQGRLLTRIVADLRTLDLAEVGELELHMEPTELSDLVTRVASDFAARAEAAGRRVVAEAVDHGGTWVLGDTDRLRQALAALVDNALRYAPEGTAVGLRAIAGTRMVRVEVDDAGPGVPEADRQRVFERFFETDPARDRADGHSGLGLAIVKALIEAHQGRVGVEERPGGGSRFWFALPAPSPPPTPPHAPPTAQA